MSKFNTLRTLLTLRRIKTSNCINIFGRRFDRNHHLVKTVNELVTEPNIQIENTALYKYHHVFIPKSTNDALGMDDLEHNYEIYDYPWGQFNKTRTTLKNPSQSRYCGPTQDTDIANEFHKLKTLLNDIQDNGYKPFTNRAIIFGSIVEQSNKKRFIPLQGNHRIAILSALNINSLLVAQHPNFINKINRIPNPQTARERDHNKVLNRFLE